ncbi:MAG: hotdog domain-containing protein, partial [Planctomycetota bacterium]
RHVEADFASPLRYGETARVQVSIARLGKSSLDFRFDVRTTDARPVGWALVTKICVDMCTFESQPIPDELRAVFERYPSDAPASDESTP